MNKRICTMDCHKNDVFSELTIHLQWHRKNIYSSMYKPLGEIPVGGHVLVQQEQAVNCKHGLLNYNLEYPYEEMHKRNAQ